MKPGLLGGRPARDFSPSFRSLDPPEWLFCVPLNTPCRRDLWPYFSMHLLLQTHQNILIQFGMADFRSYIHVL
ncbi:unnamed protein product [Rhizoctonia solani]|uniref:Uncharacterized protein n=1 Tax=Rhizoctonia solani TaxID=456999 RepID=A0A8H2XCR4_9AGAM|nr:unnamed protein product [Rhizoctonia solani]